MAASMHTKHAHGFQNTVTEIQQIYKSTEKQTILNIYRHNIKSDILKQHMNNETSHTNHKHTLHLHVHFEYV